MNPVQLNIEVELYVRSFLTRGQSYIHGFFKAYISLLTRLRTTVFFFKYISFKINC